MKTSTIAPARVSDLGWLAQRLAAEIVHRSRLRLSISAVWLSSMVLVTFWAHRLAGGKRLSVQEETAILRAVTELHRSPEVAAVHGLELHAFTKQDGWIKVDGTKIWTGIEGGPKVLISAKNRSPALRPSIRYPLTTQASEVTPIVGPVKPLAFAYLMSHLKNQAHKSEVKAVLEDQVDAILRSAGFQILPGRNRARPAHLQELAAEVKAKLGGWSDSLVANLGGLINSEDRNFSRETVTQLRPTDKELFKRLWEEHGIPTVLITAKASQEIRDLMHNDFGGGVIETGVFLAPDAQTKFTLDAIGMPWPTTWTLPPQAQIEIVEVATRLAQESRQRLSSAAQEVVRAMELAAATGPVKRSSEDPEVRAAKIWELAGEGWSRDAIAAHFGRSPKTISRWLSKGEDTDSPWPTGKRRRVVKRTDRSAPELGHSDSSVSYGPRGG